VIRKEVLEMATPIAAGIAAGLLEFANYRCTLSPGKKNILFKKRGMQAIFQSMSQKEMAMTLSTPLSCEREEARKT
jgi:hypothetical protein